MKTKIIPFDLEMAKKIQAGEIKGKIKTRDGEQEMIIVCYDSTAKYCGKTQPILAQDIDDCDDIRAYFEDGAYTCKDKDDEDLVLEVPDNEPQFKPFDKVLVRDRDNQVWHISLYESCGNDGFYVLHGIYYKQCIPYAGNESLVCTTHKPKEE